jgi:hypothetical protein
MSEASTMSHRHYHGLFEAIVVAWIADRARRRYGVLPVALIGLGIAAFWINPVLGGAYVALFLACGLIWLALRLLLVVFIAFGDFLSVEAAEERKRAAADIDWGDQAWAKIKVAPVRQADPIFHADIKLANGLSGVTCQGWLRRITVRLGIRYSQGSWQGHDRGA